MKSNFEVTIMLLITGITNFAMFPAIVILHQQRRPFAAFVGIFTMVTSFLYHCSDSIDRPLWLSEGQWHRLDNVGSIMCFLVWSVYLMHLQNPYVERCLMYLAFGIVLVLQEKAPWDERFTIYPIVFAFIMLFATFIKAGRVPPYDQIVLKKGLGFLLVGFLCFIKGLDDKNDPFRFFHGCWHGFVGIAAYYNFTVLSKHSSSSYLPSNLNHKL